MKLKERRRSPNHKKEGREGKAGMRLLTEAESIDGMKAEWNSAWDFN